jgi:hypothetical protein
VDSNVKDGRNFQNIQFPSTVRVPTDNLSIDPLFYTLSHDFAKHGQFSFSAKVITAMPTEAKTFLSLPPSGPSRNYWYNYLLGKGSALLRLA